MANSPEVPEEQGSFFEVIEKGNGLTDSEGYRVTRELAITPEGSYPSESEPVEPTTIDEADMMTGLRQEVATRRRSAAQTGKHSPLQREGTYEAVRPGDLLPDFGVVTHTNLAEAQAHAAMLERQRRAKE